MTDTASALRDQLLQLKQLHDTGAINAAAYESSKAGLERRLVDSVLAAPVAAQVQLPRPAPRVPAGMWAGLGVFAFVVAGAGYWWTGRPGELGQPPAAFTAASGAPDAAGSAPQTVTREQVTAMVDKLAARMQAQPDDAEGWNMLGRSYMNLGRVEEALAAFQRALKIKPDDANMLTEYADALAVKNGRLLDGEPTALLDRALQLEPDNLKALALAGTAAFNRGDYATAVKHWDRVVRIGPANGQLVEMVRSGVAEARERGKLPAVAAAGTPAAVPAASVSASIPASISATTSAPLSAGAADPGITGTVRLAAALQSQAAPEDTVFIFARPAEGARMPLAIVKKQVKDLPFDFKLDDSQAMSPAAKLSGTKRVIVGARISKSGQAMPQPGDLEGLSAPVDVGAAGLVVEIKTRLP